MKIFYKKGDVVPRALIKAKNIKHQKYIKFGVDTVFRINRAIRLKKCHAGIVVGEKGSKRKRAIGAERISCICKKKSFTGKYAHCAILFNSGTGKKLYSFDLN